MTTHVLSDAEYAVVTESLVRMAGLVFDVTGSYQVVFVLLTLLSSGGLAAVYLLKFVEAEWQRQPSGSMRN